MLPHDEAAIRVITADKIVHVVHVVMALDRKYAQIKYHVTKKRTPANGVFQSSDPIHMELCGGR